MAFLTKKRFFQIIRDDKSIHELKHTPVEKLHYFQIVFFKPVFAKISIGLYLLLSTLPLFIIKILWLKIIIFLLIVYTDYRNRKIIIPGLTKKLCLAELIGEK